MTTRYVRLPGAMQVINADTGEPIVETVETIDARIAALLERRKQLAIAPQPMTVSHVEIGRALVNALLASSKLDVLDAMDLRQQLCGTASTAALEDGVWKLLCEEAKKCTGLTMHAKTSPDVVAFVRAILDAPTKEPA